MKFHYFLQNEDFLECNVKCDAFVQLLSNNDDDLGTLDMNHNLVVQSRRKYVAAASSVRSRKVRKLLRGPLCPNADCKYIILTDISPPDLCMKGINSQHKTTKCTTGK